MIVYTTANSTYEVEPDLQRARRVSGESAPTPRFDPEGEWKTYRTISEHACLGGSLVVIVWPDGGYTTTSLVSRVEYVPEPFEVEP